MHPLDDLVNVNLLTKLRQYLRGCVCYIPTDSSTFFRRVYVLVLLFPDVSTLEPTLTSAPRHRQLSYLCWVTEYPRSRGQRHSADKAKY